jgi:hypothetical protein
MNLDDSEDSPPLAPSSVPPLPIEHFTEQRPVSTVPAPPPDAETVATMVIAALKDPIEKLSKQVAELTNLVNAGRTWQRDTGPVIDAINVGITGAFGMAGDAVKAATDAANGVLELDGKLTEWRKEFERNLGGRVVKIEDYLRKDGFGEGDGSIADAAEGGVAQ